MISVIIFAEGQTEEAFIKDVVAPAFWPLNLSLEPRLLPTSRTGKGGAVCYERLKFYARNTLRERSDCYLTTFLDLYGLGSDFPGMKESEQIFDLYERVNYLQDALGKQLQVDIGFQESRFFAHIQPHEYEGLLFSDIERLTDIEPNWSSARAQLAQIAAQFETPEHINNSYETKPSKRLETILTPKYRKTTHGPLAAKSITLHTIEHCCPHFRQWLQILRDLSDNL